MIKNIPNYITSLNLVFGCMGIAFVFQGHMQWAAYCIWASALADFLDGFVARALHAQSEMGLQLDSLADVVSFGVLPSFMWIYYLQQSMDLTHHAFVDITQPLLLVGFVMAVCSAWRLAKFNIDTSQSYCFKGVPTPANALVWSAIPFMAHEGIFSFSFSLFMEPWFVVGFGLVMSFLLVSPLPLIALKFKSMTLKDNWEKIILVTSVLVLVFIGGANAIMIIMPMYLILSYMEYKRVLQAQ
jgi:CDP-diacylglycerol--serine O-phosphatidyltransferase